jgi:uncharacterized tellurite resistance protein B-like protein
MGTVAAAELQHAALLERHRLEPERERLHPQPRRIGSALRVASHGSSTEHRPAPYINENGRSRRCRARSDLVYARAMDIEMRAKVSALLQAVVTADGVIQPEEREFVRRAAARWKLPEPDAPLSLRNLGTATEVLRTLDPSAQARVLALLVDAAAVDHDIDPREHALLLAAAAALGIEATALEERIIQRLKA